MKRCFLAIAFAVAVCSIASADVFTDNTGNHLTGGDLHDFFESKGFTHLDIAQVEVTNDSTFVYFDITMVGDLDATNWGKYIIGIDTGLNAGDNSTDPGSWNRAVDWGRGITDFVGSWADDGGSGAGGELRSFDGANWNLTDATYAAGTQIQASDANHAAGVQRIAIAYAALGLNTGDTLEFDVFTTGGNGGDPGVDHLSQSTFSTDDWANASTAGSFLSYTIAVPEPSSMLVLGLFGIAGMVVRRKT
ncbi:MAG: PEP-CTERM sorting domain-containing protein [Planctomycetota bacterium]